MQQLNNLTINFYLYKWFILLKLKKNQLIIIKLINVWYNIFI